MDSSRLSGLCYSHLVIGLRANTKGCLITCLSLYTHIFHGCFHPLWTCSERMSGLCPRSPFGSFRFRLVPLKTGSVGVCPASRHALKTNCTQRKTKPNSPSSLPVPTLHHLTLSIISLGSGRTFIFIALFFLTRVPSTVWVPLFPE